MSDDAYDRVTWRGVTLNKRTVAAVEAAQKLKGREFDSIPQGSYHSSTSQSAGTHDGGGAIDIYDHDLDGVCHAMRAVGFASWHRTYLPGEWSAHCHSILIADKQMSSSAADQVRDYYNNLDGLASHSHDGFWKPKPIPVFDYDKHGSLAYSHGEVYVDKLLKGQTKSDSVRRLQYRLQTNAAIAAGKLTIDGNYGPKTVAAVRKWQNQVADHPPRDGSVVSMAQAQRLFGHKSYKLHDGAP